MRYFLDTEFIERPYTIDLISIGIVSETGYQFYAESSEVDWSQADPWLLENVKPHLELTHPMSRVNIAWAIREFFAHNGEPTEFWAYYADYDWVAFCWLFGRMVDLPKGWPMMCMDLKQLMKEKNILREELPPDPVNEHHALADALWVREAWMKVDRIVANTTYE